MEIEEEKKMKGKKSNKMEIKDEEFEPKISKKKKLKGKKDEDEENYDEETREEIEEVIKPFLKLKKIQKENDKIVYNFKY